MGRYRVPSPTPSVDPDLPIPETVTPKDEPLNLQFSRRAWAGKSPLASSGAKGEDWVLYVGNLHPHVVERDLFHLFNPFLGGQNKGIKDITMRTTRGVGVNDIPLAEVTPLDRSYATVRFAKFEAFKHALESYRKNPPTLHGLTVTVALGPADLPDCKEIVRSVLGSKVDVEPITPRRRGIVRQKTLVVEDQQRPVAGPSRIQKKLAPRHNPLAR